MVSLPNTLFTGRPIPLQPVTDNSPSWTNGRRNERVSGTSSYLVRRATDDLPTALSSPAVPSLLRVYIQCNVCETFICK